MMRYVNFHFVSEEMKLINANYPDYRSHKALHDQFVVKALEFENIIHNQEFTDFKPILDFLKLWLIEHIQGVDKKYVPFLKGNLLKKEEHVI